jgi:hypothetical protein
VLEQYQIELPLDTPKPKGNPGAPVPNMGVARERAPAHVGLLLLESFSRFRIATLGAHGVALLRIVLLRGAPCLYLLLVEASVPPPSRS